MEAKKDNVVPKEILMDNSTELDPQIPINDQELKGFGLEDAEYDFEERVRMLFQNDSSTDTNVAKQDSKL